MAIISAGVIMNLIFAFIFAVIAFRIGVTEMPSIVGSVVSGGGAWQGGLRADDAIVAVAGRRIHSYQQIMQEVINSDVGRDLSLRVRRQGVKEPIELVVRPQKLGGKPTIGVGPDFDTQISKEKTRRFSCRGRRPKKPLPSSNTATASSKLPAGQS